MKDVRKIGSQEDRQEESSALDAGRQKDGGGKEGEEEGRKEG